MESIDNPQSVMGTVPHLVLFDVDGTLLLTGGAGSRCIRRACQRVLGDAFEWNPVVAGRLDQQIYRDLAEACGITDAASRFAEYKAVYLAELEAELLRCRADVRIMPGVPALLQALEQRQEVTIGLLTGNFQKAVELKFAAAGLEMKRFAVGAFAEDGGERHDLVHGAIARYEQIKGRSISADRVILIGDTPRDIECARQAGCRVLAVATGHYSLETLQAEKPDAAVATLEDTAPLWAMLEGMQTSSEYP